MIINSLTPIDTRNANIANPNTLGTILVNKLFNYYKYHYSKHYIIIISYYYYYKLILLL